jgi:hypothetical protein
MELPIFIGWECARRSYNWRVDLRRFADAPNYPENFDRVIEPEATPKFETDFRDDVDDVGNERAYVRAGEVCFWKNWGIPPAAKNLTQNLLKHLSDKKNWSSFCQWLQTLSKAEKPSWDNFQHFQEACCNMKAGFANPITFLSFYNAIEYPMADKVVAGWWGEHKERHGYHGYKDHPAFKVNKVVPPTPGNWEAYLAWKRFCCDYAGRLNRTGNRIWREWRARDVEMAVWQAQRNRRGNSLEVIGPQAADD